MEIFNSLHATPDWYTFVTIRPPAAFQEFYDLKTAWVIKWDSEVWLLSMGKRPKSPHPPHLTLPHPLSLTPAKCISCLSGSIHAWVLMHVCVITLLSATSWSRVKCVFRYFNWNDGLFLWDPEFISSKDICSVCAPQGPDLLLPVLVDFLVLFWLASIP